MSRQQWLAAEPDDDIRSELNELIVAAQRDEPGAVDDLSARFAGVLEFGTAGLRAAVAAGSMRMNRLVVRQAAAGIGRWLLDAEANGTIPDASARGVVIAHDARRKSDLFADDTARVLVVDGDPIDAAPRRAAHTSAGLVDHRDGRRSRRGRDGVAQPARRQRLQGLPSHRVADRVAGRHRHLRTHRDVRPAHGRGPRVPTTC